MSAAHVLFPSLNQAPKKGGPKLLADARRGDCEAFAQMVSPYVSTLYRRARRLTGNAEDAEDVSQEAVLKAWSRLEQFSGTKDATGNEFGAWISRIGANSSIDVLRARRDGKLISLEEPKSGGEETLGNGIAAREENPEEQYARREMKRLLADAILRLAPDLRQTCLLRDVLHYSTQEVAERLGISTVAVRLRLFRAHRNLRENLLETLQPKRDGRPLRRVRRHAPKAVVEFVPITAEMEYACGD